MWEARCGASNPRKKTALQWRLQSPRRVDVPIKRTAFSAASLGAALLGCVLLSLPACAPQEPLRIGFIGGLSGRVSDLGISGRDGALLAVEMRNAAGGIAGRKIELLAEDDEQDAEMAAKVVARLAALKVAAIVGPMTSAMATAIVPLVSAAQLTTVSPTATTNALTGRDDHFFRVLAATAEFARMSADYHARVLGLRRVAAIADDRNRAYTASWLDDYRAAFAAGGGVVSRSLLFSPGETTRFDLLAHELLEGKPDGVLILANSVDAAMLCQHLRKLSSSVVITTSEWAATEQFIELGGRAVEGAVVGQFLDRDSKAPSWLEFRRRYRERFGREPGFGGLTAFDATNIVLEGLARQRPGQSLKESLLAIGRFAGAQRVIVLDEYGDTFNVTRMTVIRDGAFVALP